MLGPFLLLSTLFINEENQPLVPAAGCSLCCCSGSTWPRAWNVRWGARARFSSSPSSRSALSTGISSAGVSMLVLPSSSSFEVFWTLGALGSYSSSSTSPISSRSARASKCWPSPNVGVARTAMLSKAQWSTPLLILKYPPSPHSGPHEFWTTQYFPSVPSPKPTTMTAWVVFSQWLWRRVP